MYMCDLSIRFHEVICRSSVLSSDDKNVFIRLADFKMMGNPVFVPPTMLVILLITKY